MLSVAYNGAKGMCKVVNCECCSALSEMGMTGMLSAMSLEFLIENWSCMGCECGTARDGLSGKRGI